MRLASPALLLLPLCPSSSIYANASAMAAVPLIHR
jgi:hypothetical protein